MASKTDAAGSRVSEHAASQVLMLAPPWAGLVLCLAVGALFHSRWPQWWGGASVAFCGTVLTAVTWLVAHDKSLIGRASALATSVWATGWITAATLAGFTSKVMLAYVTGGFTVALANNIRTHARHRSAGLDLLARLFDDIADVAGVPGASMHVLGRDKQAKAIRAVVVGKPGQHTGKQLAETAPLFESGFQFPPGAMTMTASAKARHVAEVRISDPQVIDKPLLWPGPSKPGGSLADPLIIGTYQTGQPMAYRLLEHLRITGTTGAAKSTGGGWTMLAELITRRDVAVYGLDITKGMQTLGPFAPALGGLRGGPPALITDPAMVEPFMAWAHGQIRPRTDYLASRGLQQWDEGCGKPAMVVWMEEGPDLLNQAMSDEAVERWVSSSKAARSAGIFWVFSCQRPDYSQMPTLARSMFTGSLAFGAGDAKDDQICLSERQQQAGCEPSLWANREPGKCYLDGQMIPDDLVGVAGRVFHWGADLADTRKLDDSRIKAHVAQYAAMKRDLGGEVMPDDSHSSSDSNSEEAHTQPVSAPLTGVPGSGDTDDPRAEAQQLIASLDDGSPAPEQIISPAGAADWAFTAEAEPAPAVEPDAKAALAALINEWADAGKRRFRERDLVDFRLRVGRSRSWLQAKLAELRAEGLIGHDDDNREWIIEAA